MADTQPPRVDSGILEMWRRDGRLYAIAGFLAGVMLFPLLASLGGDQLTSFLQELVPELVGIGLTVFLIDRIIRRRDERNAEAALKRQLVMDAGSQSNEKAKDAVHQLRRKRWLTGENGLLKGADLMMANLQGANLNYANLHGISLHEGNLREALLNGVDLREAKLPGVNLQGTLLMGASLHGTTLWETNLQGADLNGAHFNETTELPDVTYWTPETDMSRFTDPNHPNFWRSDNKNSPAYGGKSEA